MEVLGQGTEGDQVAQVTIVVAIAPGAPNYVFVYEFEGGLADGTTQRGQTFQQRGL